jgi:hypothetical protein
MKQLNYMRYLNTLLLATILCTLVSLPVMACESIIVVAEADRVTLDQAVNRVKENNRGKVLGAKTIQVDGQAVHVIKVLTKNGRVKKLRIQGMP